MMRFCLCCCLFSGLLGIACGLPGGSADRRPLPPLAIALETRDAAALSRHFDRDQDIVSQTNRFGETPLFIAALRGDRALFRRLLKTGGHSLANIAGHTLLMAAAESGDPEILEAAHALDGNVSRRSQYGLSALLLAGSDTNALRLLDWGAPPDVADHQGTTALMYAAAKGHTRTVRRLLLGAATNGINRNNGYDETALLLAANAEIFDLLLAAGAGTGAKSKLHGPLAVVAAKRGFEKGLRVLLERGADFRGTDQFEATALHWAAAHGHPGCARLLLDAGASIDARNDERQTPLMWCHHPELVRLLLSRGASPAAQDKWERSVLMWYTQQGYADLARIVLDAGAPVNALCARGRTALIYAADLGRTEIVRMLLERGANRNLFGYNGMTALMMAVQEDHPEVVRLLLAAGARTDTTAYDADALVHAMENGHTHLIGPLLDAGADPYVYHRRTKQSLFAWSKGKAPTIHARLLAAGVTNRELKAPRDLDRIPLSEKTPAEARRGY
jgi:ankyrin repeat protein